MVVTVGINSNSNINSTCSWLRPPHLYPAALAWSPTNTITSTIFTTIAWNSSSNSSSSRSIWVLTCIEQSQRPIASVEAIKKRRRLICRRRRLQLPPPLRPVPPPQPPPHISRSFTQLPSRRRLQQRQRPIPAPHYPVFWLLTLALAPLQASNSLQNKTSSTN